jgi:hypothetical protein
VALAREEARGRVEADPPGAGEIDLTPGVEVDEVGLRAGGAVERLHVGDELDEVPDTKRAAKPRWRRSWTRSQPESRHEPVRFSSVSSGVWRPGSRRTP